MRPPRKQTPETALKKAIKDLIGACGIYSYPLRQGLGSHPGLPDIQALYQGQTWHIEAKVGKNKLSQHQLKFQAECERASVPYIEARSVEDVATAMKLSVVFS